MRDLSMIGEKYRDIIKEDIEKRRQKLELCIQQNSLFLCKIVTSHKDLFTWKELKTGDKFLEPFYIESKNVSKLRSTLRQIRREWSSEGKWERDQSFKPILEALEQEWPLDNKEIKREEINVLCPVRKKNNFFRVLDLEDFRLRFPLWDFHLKGMSSPIICC